jgi:hypothetical protein
VLLHLGGAEQFRSKGRLIVDALVRRAVSTEARPQLVQAPDNGRAEGRQAEYLPVEKLSVNRLFLFPSPMIACLIFILCFFHEISIKDLYQTLKNSYS